jgi:hypothetical protein
VISYKETAIVVITKQWIDQIKKASPDLIGGGLDI